MPIRDMHSKDFKRIAFKVIVYGWEARDAAVVPGGSEPFRHAVERMGLSTDRYQPIIWDLPIKRNEP